MSTITCPQFCEMDSEIIEDFSECLRENVEAIESCLSLLDEEQSPNQDLVHRLFRDIHSLKGNCRMVFLDPLVETIHSLEEIVSEMRQEKRNYHPAYGEFFMSTIVHLESMIDALLREGEVNDGQQTKIMGLIKTILAAETGKDVDALNQALILLSASSHSNEDDFTSQPENKQTSLQAPKSETEEDLAFFKKLSLQLDGLNPSRTERTQTILDLCLSTNNDMGKIVDIEQLTAAVYMHDFGMALVPYEILAKPTKLNAKEVERIHNHVGIGAQLLHRMKGWDEAAEIVLQHHEHYNGRGYPLKISGGNIHPGAMIIALADTFYAVTNERVDRSDKKSLFSAVTLINGESGEQFDPKFVEAFNETVRRNYIARRNKS